MYIRQTSTNLKQKLLLYRTTTKLGSGQFGCVNKGVWHSSEGPVDVAIKTLKLDSSVTESALLYTDYKYRYD